MNGRPRVHGIPMLTLVLAAALGGCATPQQQLDSLQGEALTAAQNRGRFELNCPNTREMVLSREIMQPVIQGPWVGGVQRAEYTIGVEGCGQRASFVVICPIGGSGCFATGSGAWVPR